MKKTFYEPVLSPVEEEEESEQSVKFCPKNTKRNRKQYKRNIKRQRRSYFVKIVEEKKWHDDTFLDNIHNWYFVGS